MSSQLIRRRRIGPHLEITLDDGPRQNALSPEMVGEFDAALAASAAEQLSSLIVRGANGVFCAGADLKSLSSALSQSPGPGEADPLRELNAAGGRFFQRLAAHPMATIAVVDGAAVGGGFGVACACDIVVATPRARFALSETSLGLTPAQIAPHVVGRLGARHARRLALTGARIDGREALAIGLADYLCESDEERESLVERMLAQIARCAPGANAEAKRLIACCRDGATDAYIEEAATSFAASLRGAEGREGLAAFAGKRAPAWTGRFA